ncbi:MULTISPECIES: ATP-binding protein [Caulobacter]|jgi:two-component system osmolarity sensor histidine kinase EnvZ|uniref:histidine kinase n=1 Tax=Caulobacter vibrioides OR37 TaxID=1292034 RepID=R0EJF1_CAUVI|nr:MULTISPECIES: ATP-binding protein [Caulobacter]ENZ82104.1 signal transduction histidine kinase [Caulobacter vibrioides OR37]MBQ1563415.1 ATP-binding protein [Caulobacter sp.]
MRLRTRLYIPRVIKRLLPTSLFGRSLLIIILPVAVMQIAVTWAFFDAHWQAVTSKLSEGLAGDIAWAVQSYEDDPSPAAVEKLAKRAEDSMSLSIAFQKGRKLPTGHRPSLFAALDRSLQHALEDRLDNPFWFDTTRYTAYIDIRVQVQGGVLQIYALRDRAYATQGHIFILWMVVATLLLTAVAILFIRNQVRAIERLADAADAFGRGEDNDFKPHGAREVRQAAQAFLAMKARIVRHIEQRTALLASVSHDLRTPLTRLKLEMALSEPSEQIEAMKGDLAEMEHMIDEYLAFARGEGGEAAQVVDLAELVEGVVASAERAGAAIETQIAPGLEARLRPLAFRRALANLIDNGLAHARHVRVSVAPRLTGGVEIAVDDDGPGIPEDRYEEAFKPFSRLDESRNQNEKGVGLGLAIARDMARGLGGDLVLARSALGGLRASIRLPG